MTTRFINVVSDQDTLIVYGLARNEFGQQGLLFLRIDTLGNVLSTEHHVDSISPPYFARQGHDLQISPEGKYQFVGDDTEGGIIAVTGRDGELVTIHTFPKAPFLWKCHSDISRVAQGNVVGGSSQVESGRMELFLQFIDGLGQVTHEVEFGDLDNYFLLGDLMSNSTSHIVVGSYIQESRGELGWEQPWIFCIDTLGEIQWEWFGERDIKGGVVDDLVLTPDGGYAFLNTFVDTVIFVGIDAGFKRGRLVKLDSNRNVEWKTTIGIPSLEVNDLTELVMTEEGDFLATGKYSPNEINGQGLAMVNWTVKFSAEGEVIWERFDSTIYTPERGVWNDPSGITLLSSGSIIICGSARHLLGDDQQERGYLIKLDKNGCAVPGCELGPLTRLEVPYQAMPEVRIFPNPASESVTVELLHRADILMFDAQGRFVLARDDAMGSVRLDVALVPFGLYFLRIATRQGWTVRKVVVE
ncbi:MAG: T9SS type A sorting domain-containing protein [Saprospiraceae bacterium]|nr:T9SS type A sorting domain-containing protein [Saprospiraceae bacterium]